MNPELWDQFAAKFGIEMATAKLGPRPGQEAPAPAPAAPAGDPAYKPAFARDAMTFTPEQAKAVAPVLAGTAMSAIPGGGFFGRQAVGGATGAAMGAMQAEPGHRMKGAVTGGLLGMGASVAGEGGAGLLNAVLRRGAGRGARVGAALAEKTGLPTDFEGLAGAAEGARKAASKSLFGPIDNMGPINNAKITTILEESGVPNAGKPRTLSELQALTGRLDRTNPVAARELKDVMEAEIPGLAGANKAYGPLARPVEAIDAGRASYKTAADIRKAMEGMGATEARNFRAARLHDILAALEKRDEDAVGMLKQFMDAGPETKAQLRTLFDSDERFDRFLQVLGRERSAEKVGAALKRWAPWGLGGLLGIGAAESARSLFK